MKTINVVNEEAIIYASIINGLNKVYMTLPSYFQSRKTVSHVMTFNVILNEHKKDFIVKEGFDSLFLFKAFYDQQEANSKLLLPRFLNTAIYAVNDFFQDQRNMPKQISYFKEHLQKLQVLALKESNYPNTINLCCCLANVIDKFIVLILDIWEEVNSKEEESDKEVLTREVSTLLFSQKDILITTKNTI